MKYLKLFEYKNIDFYSQVGIDFYLDNKYLFKPFTDSEIRNLSNLIGEDLWPSQSGRLLTSLNQKVIASQIIFRKLSDEWYIIRFFLNSDYVYKCDQWEGLVKCIQDKILNPR